MPPPPVWELNQAGNRSISDSAISRVSAVAFRQKGVTLEDIIKELRVSRTTAMKWLTLMHAEGFLSRSNHPTGGRGRPRWVYHPTASLRARVVSFDSASIAVLTFASLQAACRHLADGECTQKQQSCTIAVCPMLHS